MRERCRLLTWSGVPASAGSALSVSAAAASQWRVGEPEALGVQHGRLLQPDRFVLDRQVGVTADAHAERAHVLRGQLPRSGLGGDGG